MGDKEITIQFADGRKAKIVKIEDLDTKKFIDKLSAKIMELEKIPNKIRDKNKELTYMIKKIHQHKKEQRYTLNEIQAIKGVLREIIGE